MATVRKRKKLNARASASDRRERFIAEYLADPKRNATQAAIRAGYARPGARAAASRLLADPGVAAEIDRRIGRVHKKLADRYEVNAERITRELAKIGFASVRDYGVVTDDGQFHVDLSVADEDAFAAVMSVKSKRTVRGKGDGAEVETTTELRLADKRAALDTLAKVVGLYRDEPVSLLPVTFIIRNGPDKPEDYPP